MLFFAEAGPTLHSSPESTITILEEGLPEPDPAASTFITTSMPSITAGTDEKNQWHADRLPGQLRLKLQLGKIKHPARSPTWTGTVPSSLTVAVPGATNELTFSEHHVAPIQPAGHNSGNEELPGQGEGRKGLGGGVCSEQCFNRCETRLDSESDVWYKQGGGHRDHFPSSVRVVPFTAAWSTSVAKGATDRGQTLSNRHAPPASCKAAPNAQEEERRSKQGRNAGCSQSPAQTLS